MPEDIDTISAWAFLISTLVSALTGFFIVQTFLLQAKVAQEQSLVTKLEIERSLLQNRPLFIAERKGMDFIQRQEILFRYKFQIELKRGDITHYSLRIDMLHGAKKVLKFSEFPGEIMAGMIEGTKVNIYYDLLASVKSEIEQLGTTTQSLSFQLQFKYKDILGNDYEQQVIFGHGLDPVALPPIGPQLSKKLKLLTS